MGQPRTGGGGGGGGGGALGAFASSVRQLSAADVRAMSGFGFDQRIGSGGFGEVYGGMWNGASLAIKKRFRSLPDLNAECAAFPHANVIRAVAYCSDAQMLAIIYPRYTPLTEALIGTPANRWAVVRQYAAGVHHLHTVVRRAHRDIKPDNCLLTVDRQDVVQTALVIDLGISRSISQTHRVTGAAGTLFFMGPDAIHTGQARLEHDLYALALFIACVLHGVMFPESDAHAYELLRSGTPALTDLLARMRHRQLDRRPSMDEVCAELERQAPRPAGRGTPPPQAAGGAGRTPPRTPPPQAPHSGLPPGFRPDSYEERQRMQSDVVVPLRPSRRPHTVVFASVGEDVCAVCQNTIETGEPVHTAICSDTFHKECVEQWWQRSHFCPTCRKDLHA